MLLHNFRDAWAELPVKKEVASYGYVYCHGGFKVKNSYVSLMAMKMLVYFSLVLIRLYDFLKDIEKLFKRCPT